MWMPQHGIEPGPRITSRGLPIPLTRPKSVYIHKSRNFWDSCVVVYFLFQSNVMYIFHSLLKFISLDLTMAKYSFQRNKELILLLSAESHILLNNSIKKATFTLNILVPVNSTNLSLF